VAGCASLIEVLESHALRQPDAMALAFLSDSGRVEAQLTFADLADRAFAQAAVLMERGAAPGDRAILAFPPGLDFMVGFFGCLAAGVIAVPLAPPRRAGKRDSSANIVADCRPRFALTSASSATPARDGLLARFADHPLEWVIVADETPARADRAAPLRRPESRDIAFLQYTSGSTSLPKGVMVSHANLVANLEMIRLALGNSRASTYVSWTPLHHDMGLILNVLQAFYIGAAAVLMPPVSFLQRPLSWLKAIHDYRAEAAGGPNFCFDLCVSRFRAEAMEGVDLSHWRVAFNGAEPVRADTLRRFAATFAPYGFDAGAFYPCYGMAESTLLISGGRRGAGATIEIASRAAMQGLRIQEPLSEADAIAIVGCGRALAGETIAIVDPDTLERCDGDQIGEIWVAGPHVANGYWRNEAATRETFGGAIAGESGVAWLRTGDLGRIDRRGELFITGRIKDLIIVRGVNHYPQDIEYSAQKAHASLRPGFGAAFAIADREGQERVVIVQEVERTHRHRIDLAEVVADIREAVAEEHELALHDVALVQPGTIPKTTSGKIQRRLIRRLWQEGGLEIVPISANRPSERSAQP
jgi:acyl-CoA synthetase (AMP-forming)/AMP-acid ligase II